MDTSLCRSAGVARVGGVCALLLVALAADAGPPNDVEFVSAGGFTTTSGVTARVRLPDLNQDGRLDVFLYKSFGAGIFTTLNLGDGEFGPVVESDDNVTSYPAYGVGVGDLTGDGFPDAVIGHSMGPGSMNLSVVFGNGDGTFTNGPLLNSGNGSVPAVAIGDLNGDGLGDIRSTPNTTRLALPGGQFAATIYSGGGGYVCDPLLADVNGDGVLDAVQVVDTGDVDFGQSDVVINHGQGDGAFTLVQEIHLGLRVGQSPLTPRYELAHLNDDDLLDLVVFGFKGNHSGPGGLRLLKNLGGTYEVVYEEVQAEIGDTTLQAPTGDFNGDGIDDILVLRKPDGVSEIRISDGEFGFTAVVPISTPFEYPWEASAALVADLVGSPLPDILFVKDPSGAGEAFILHENVTPVKVVGDVTNDGTVNVEDLLAVITGWGECPSPPSTPCGADIAPAPNGDGEVNVEDLLMVITNWG